MYCISSKLSSTSVRAMNKEPKLIYSMIDLSVLKYFILLTIKLIKKNTDNNKEKKKKKKKLCFNYCFLD